MNDDYNETEKALLCPWFGLTLNVPFYGSREKRTLGDATIYPNNYKYFNIRSYLNGKQNKFVLDGAQQLNPILTGLEKALLILLLQMKQRF